MGEIAAGVIIVTGPTAPGMGGRINPAPPCAIMGIAMGGGGWLNVVEIGGWYIVEVCVDVGAA